MFSNNSPKHLKDILNTVSDKLKHVKKTSSELIEKQQQYYDEVLQVNFLSFNETTQHLIYFEHLGIL